MKRILCLRLPNWPLARLIVARPELKGEGVALFSRTARGEPIVACSAAASRLGVRIGMPRSEAESLTPRRGNRGLIFEPHDPAADRAALEALAAWCERWSPMVGLEAGELPQCLLLDLTGIGPLFGGEAVLVDRALQGLKEQGYRALAAVGETIGAAWGQAWFAESSHHAPRDESVTRSVTSTMFPLDDLPVAALRLEPQTLSLLEELGLERIGQLRALPRGALAARFGGDARHQSPATLSALPGEAFLLRRLDQFDGLVPEVILPHRAAADWEVGWQLEYSTASRAVVERMVDRLVGMLAEQLAERQREVVRLECRLKLAGADPVTLVIGLSQPSALAAHLAELVHLQLARLSLPGAVMGVTLKAAEIASRAERQQELFPDPSRHDSRQRAWLLDRLTSRLGEDAVTGAQSRGDPLPERAFRFASLTSAAAARPVRRVAPKIAALPVEEVASPSHAPLHRPVLLMAAQAVAVMAIAPEGVPRRFTLSGNVYDIVRQWGPERIETGWWRGRSVRRDYYRVETTSGEQFWLFRQLGNGGWKLQGVFA